MPELPVIQSLNRTVFKSTTSAEIRFRRPAFRGIAFHIPRGKGSIPTAPTNHPFSQLSDLSRRQKAAIRAPRVAPMAGMKTAFGEISKALMRLSSDRLSCNTAGVIVWWVALDANLQLP